MMVVDLHPVVVITCLAMVLWFVHAHTDRHPRGPDDGFGGDEW